MTTESCPYCGSGLEELSTHEQPPVTSDGRPRLSVVCRSCGGRGPNCATEELAWELWNKRPEVERLRGDVAEAGTWAEATTVLRAGLAEAEAARLRGEVATLLAAADADAMMLTQVGRERDEARAEVERLRAELQSCRAQREAWLAMHPNGACSCAGAGECQWCQMTELRTERDRLRAVLAETEENRETVAEVLMRDNDGDVHVDARAVLAALRARAGMEP